MNLIDRYKHIDILAYEIHKANKNKNKALIQLIILTIIWILITVGAVYNIETTVTYTRARMIAFLLFQLLCIVKHWFTIDKYKDASRLLKSFKRMKESESDMFE